MQKSPTKEPYVLHRKIFLSILLIVGTPYKPQSILFFYENKCIYIYICIYTYIFIYINICICIIDMYVYICICTCIYKYTCIYTHVHTHTHKCTHVYIYVHICTYLYSYIHTHTQTQAGIHHNPFLLKSLTFLQKRHKFIFWQTGTNTVCVCVSAKEPHSSVRNSGHPRESTKETYIATKEPSFAKTELSVAVKVLYLAARKPSITKHEPHDPTHAHTHTHTHTNLQMSPMILQKYIIDTYIKDSP